VLNSNADEMVKRSEVRWISEPCGLTAENGLTEGVVEKAFFTSNY
jgi:hypothetical protein